MSARACRTADNRLGGRQFASAAAQVCPRVQFSKVLSSVHAITCTQTRRRMQALTSMHAARSALYVPRPASRTTSTESKGLSLTWAARTGAADAAGARGASLQGRGARGSLGSRWRVCARPLCRRRGGAGGPTACAPGPLARWRRAPRPRPGRGALGGCCASIGPLGICVGVNQAEGKPRRSSRNGRCRRLQVPRQRLCMQRFDECVSEVRHSCDLCGRNSKASEIHQSARCTAIAMAR